MDLSASDQEFFWDSVWDAVADERGDIFAVGDLCPASMEVDGCKDVWPALWCFDSSLKLRWSRPRAVQASVLIALFPDRRLIVWPGSGIDAPQLVFGREDGHPIPQPGALPDLKDCVRVFPDRDGTLLRVTTTGGITRCAPDGTERPLYPRRKGFFAGLRSILVGDGDPLDEQTATLTESGLLVVRKHEGASTASLFSADGRAAWSVPFATALGALASCRLTAVGAQEALLHDPERGQLVLLDQNGARVLVTGEDLRNARVVPLPGSGYWCLMEGGAAKRFDRFGKLAFANAAAKLASG